MKIMIIQAPLVILLLLFFDNCVITVTT